MVDLLIYSFKLLETLKFVIEMIMEWFFLQLGAVSIFISIEVVSIVCMTMFVKRFKCER